MTQLMDCERTSLWFMVALQVSTHGIKTMKDSSGFNIHKELNKEVVHLYCTAKTYLYLQRNWPVSEAGDPDIFNFFVVILQSLWRDIVVSIGSLIIDKRRDVANF